MRRRITRAIVGVTAAVLVVLSVGLVIVARRDIVNREEVELQSEVARTLTEIDTPLDPTQLRTISAEPDAPPTPATAGSTPPKQTCTSPDSPPTEPGGAKPRPSLCPGDGLASDVVSSSRRFFSPSPLRAHKSALDQALAASSAEEGRTVPAVTDDQLRV